VKTQVNVYQNVKLVHHYLNRERWALSKVILRRFSDLFLLHITVRPTVSRGSLRPLLGRSQAWRYCGQCSDQSIEAGITACSAKSTSIWHYSRLSMAARRDWYQMWTLFGCFYIVGLLEDMDHWLRVGLAYLCWHYLLVLYLVFWAIRSSDRKLLINLLTYLLAY